MFKIDTTGIPRYEGRTMELEFQYDQMADGSVITTARITEFQNGDAPPAGGEWLSIPSGWKHRHLSAQARCSPADQFCRETGRRIAVNRLLDVPLPDAPDLRQVAKAARRQFGLDRMKRRKARGK